MWFNENMDDFVVNLQIIKKLMTNLLFNKKIEDK